MPGLGAPGAAGLGALSDPAGAFGLLAGLAVVVAIWTAGYGAWLGRVRRAPGPPVGTSPGLERGEANEQAGRTGTRT
ncbi:MAG TPA: hypothetical protein VMA97_13840 [Streptosporangiaceae bacterium]|nr:hypothetical protein [Streptosporangiaceae bacterium]